MSLEGGFEEFPECFWALAKAGSSLATKASRDATLASSSAHHGQPFSCLISAMMAVNLSRSVKMDQDQFQFRERLRL